MNDAMSEFDLPQTSDVLEMHLNDLTGTIERRGAIEQSFFL